MMKKQILLASLATVAMTGTAYARDQIRIVGSSTVYPFTTAVAEEFGQQGFPTPIVESTGTGGGFRMFCGGVGAEHPDFSNASRAIEDSELEMCAGNGVTEVIEMKVGYDGIVFANHIESIPIDLSKEQIFLALAAEVPVDGEIVANPYNNWRDIDPSLPDTEITVFGPPPTSGTRDAFVELVMEVACESFPEIEALEEERMEAVCQTMREDGKFIEAGENDNLIIQRLDSDHSAFGIFGYSFLERNLDHLQGNLIGGVEPTFENISSGAYRVSRSLFLYVKAQHIGVIPGMEEFLEEYTSEAAWGPEGYLADKGLIPMGEGERRAVLEQVQNRETLQLP